ncbi:hypothetical protein K7G91_000869 [Pasteurella canis]|uniref:hypothetical protein n=1 Tax=Pasteurella canis TaxID=753 RepID=UPI000666BAEB|nr:hypothetical protein [Pasteurella canis]UDW84584.1 hypothetical protein K7G91_000869 [Pasteurella canis]
MNFETTQRLLTKLRAALQKKATLDGVNYAEKEKELKNRMTELTNDTEPNGTALVDTARELQNLRTQRDKHTEKVTENDEVIAKLKFLLSEQIAAIPGDEQLATLEDFGL